MSDIELQEDGKLHLRVSGLGFPHDQVCEVDFSVSASGIASRPDADNPVLITVSVLHYKVNGTDRTDHNRIIETAAKTLKSALQSVLDDLSSTYQCP